jgi:hypothetical protein
VGLLGFRKKERRLRPLGEAECYGRAYGERTQDVRVMKLEPRRPRFAAILASGEELRQRFAARLEAREPQRR